MLFRGFEGDLGLGFILFVGLGSLIVSCCVVFWMDDKIIKRFHFGGWFCTINGHVHYLGGDLAESLSDVDKLSYFEIKGHLQDHFTTESILRLFWLKPRKQMRDGLVLLVDDQSC
jgi:hypothetical protein